MRRRINESAPTAIPEPFSDLYKRFWKHFKFLLSPLDPSAMRRGLPDAYVSLPSIEEQLRNLLFLEPVDSVAFLVGHTGIGKSTVLRHVCACCDNSKYRPDHNTYLLYINCDRKRIAGIAQWERAFSSCIADAGLQLRAKCEDTLTIEGIAEIISQENPEVLSRPILDLEASPTMRLKQLQITDRRAYELELLKLFATNANLERVCLVVDDLESLPHSMQAEVLKDLLNAMTCLMHKNDRPYTVGVLLAIRPDSYATFRARGLLDAWPLNDAIDFRQSVDLCDLFEARFECARAIVNEPHLLDDWNESMEVLRAIARKLDLRFATVIAALENSNVRDALGTFTRVLENRTWFEGEHTHAKHVFHEGRYQITNAGVLRAIAMPRTGAYFDIDTLPIPNLLHNSADSEDDLIVSYIVRYLMERAKDDTLGSLWIPDDLHELIPIADKLWSSAIDAEKGVLKAVAWMIRRKLLLQLSPDELDKNLRVTLAPRCRTLWGLLAESSVLLECYREDTYRELDETDAQWRRSETLSREVLFTDCVRLGRAVAAVERKHLDIADTRDKLGLMRQTFGTNLLSRQLTRGLQAAFPRYFTEGRQSTLDLRRDLNSLASEVAAMEERLVKVLIV